MIEYYKCPILPTCRPLKKKQEIIPSNEDINKKNENQTTPASHYTTPIPSKICPFGHYLENNDCKTCPAGSYCINNKKFSCSDGKFSTSGSTGCQYDITSCPKGTYSGSNQDCLLNCGTKFADARLGYGKCNNDCLYNGKISKNYTDINLNFCLKSCPAGTYWYNNTCSKCAAKTYRAEGETDTRCTHTESTCPDKTYSYSDSTRQACLKSCPAGYYASQDKICLKCKNGYSIEGSTGTTDVSGCKFTENDCPAGTYADSSKLACVSCIGDSYSTEGSIGKNNEEGCKYKYNTCPVGTKPGSNNDCI